MEKNFQPPRHWLGLEELDQNYWVDSEKRKDVQDFSNRPYQALDLLEKLDSKGVARRDFLTIMGASMALASLSCARKPVNKIIPYVVKPEEVTPGIPTWYASTCRGCDTGCGVLVKNREGRPIKLEGSPEHEINRGSLCARGQASVLDLYDPDRLKSPVQISRKDGKARKVTWSQVDSDIRLRLKVLASGSSTVRLLRPMSLSETTNRLTEEFLAAFKNAKQVEYNPLYAYDAVKAQDLSYGTRFMPSYHFDKAHVIVSLGADFLGDWQSPVEYAKDWSKRRKLSGKSSSQATLSKLYSFESGFSVTGANADERIALRPGDELKIALALAHEILITQGVSSWGRDPQVIMALKGYHPKAVAKEIGGSVTVDLIKRVAKDLIRARGESLVVAGGIATQGPDSLGLQVAVNLLNSALNNDGVTVEVASSPTPPKAELEDLIELVREMNEGKVDALILHSSNPLHVLPKSLGFEEALKKVPLIVSISDRIDETATVADYVLPESHYLESWGDYHPRANLYSLQQPTVAPIHETKSYEEILIDWVKEGGFRVEGLLSQQIADKNANLTFHDYLRENWRSKMYPRFGSGQSFESFWVKSVQRGVIGNAPNKGAPRRFRSSALKVVRKYQPNDTPLSLALYTTLAMAEGKAANNAWLQELPDPISTATWGNYLNISPATAKRLGLKTHDVVALKQATAEVEVPVHVQPGLHDGSVTLALGYGRKAVGNVGDGVGVNGFQLVAADGGMMSFSGRAVEIRKTGKRHELAITQGHHRTENRPIINDVTLKEYRKNSKVESHTDPHLRLKKVPTLWPKHDYSKGYRWGMTIDLNSCTGCKACVTACQAENNIPVVGRDRVLYGREMHWIRIDRYYSGETENPDVVFQPMLCQHCENAPCETVCPVLATVHNSEGLNEMVYNRCVGTRYCQNNCPYKVRRFNFFDHWKDYQDPMNLVWNPEVTVRSRGVMEKCTFCVQRVNEAKWVAKDKGRKVRDGDLKTACQQSCPTDAIAFGDVNNPDSEVSTLRNDDRAFRVLEILATVPSISYLTKVRNKDKVEGAGSNGHS